MKILLTLIALIPSTAVAATHHHCIHENGQITCRQIPPPSGLFTTPTRLCLCRDIGPRGGCRAWTCRRVF